MRSEDIWVGGFEAVDEVDLLVGGLDRGSVVVVSVVCSVGWARPEDGPEGAAVMAGVETGDVDVSRETALLKGFRKGGVIDVIVVEDTEKDREVVVAVWKVSQRGVKRGTELKKHELTDKGSLGEDSLDSLLDGLVTMQTAWKPWTWQLLPDWLKGVGEE
jgi:hypothetical protein